MEWAVVYHRARASSGPTVRPCRRPVVDQEMSILAVRHCRIVVRTDRAVLAKYAASWMMIHGRTTPGSSSSSSCFAATSIVRACRPSRNPMRDSHAFAAKAGILSGLLILRDDRWRRVVVFWYGPGPSWFGGGARQSGGSLLRLLDRGFLPPAMDLVHPFYYCAIEVPPQIRREYHQASAEVGEDGGLGTSSSWSDGLVQHRDLWVWRGKNDCSRET